MRAIILSCLLFAAPAAALNEGLQCVPYARALSGVEIRGDAHTWWHQADGKYDRGVAPRVGAVLAFQPYGKMRLGHVAAVRRIIDERTILISHANWSTIGGIRGHIEQDVRAIDVSEDNDWSAVRVWYTPNAALGSTQWPAYGFIYPRARRSEVEAQKALASLLADKPQAPAVVQLAAARPAADLSARTGFDLSSSLMSDIDRKAAREAKGKRSTASLARRDPIADIMAKLNR